MDKGLVKVEQCFIESEQLMTENGKWFIKVEQ
jgi:hypothetical protein